MELTLKEKLYYYKELLRNINRIKDTIISLTMLYNVLELEKEFEQDLEDNEEEILEHLEWVKNEIKEKYNLNIILENQIKNITLDDILEL